MAIYVVSYDVKEKNGTPASKEQSELRRKEVLNKINSYGPENVIMLGGSAYAIRTEATLNDVFKSIMSSMNINPDTLTILPCHNDWMSTRIIFNEWRSP